MKRSPVSVVVGVLAAASLALTGCSSASPTASPSASGAKTYKIGITQIVAHPSLDAAREGFKKAVSDAGLKATYDEKNAQGEFATATAIANTFNSGGYDLVLAIATPTAEASVQVITKIPILFTAVTDPVTAELVNTNEAPGGNVTGTTDMNPVADQIKIVKRVKPDAKTLGVIYSSGEVNSAVQVKLARAAAAAEGLTLVEKTVTKTDEVAQAAASLSVDAIYVPTDNNVVSGLSSVVQVAEQKKIPLVVGEGDSVNKGGLITYGIDYGKLGYQTGQMAVKILKDGAKPATMPVESQTQYGWYVNTKAAARMGVTLPADLVAEATDVGA